MRQRTLVIGVGCVVLGLAGACNSLDEPKEESGARVVVPVDERPVQQALTTLPAISGGTLASSQDGRFAVVADPDRDRVTVVDLISRATNSIELEAGDEPGRVITDAAGNAYVALRRAGDVLRLDIASGAIQQRVHVCSAPRGLALDAQQRLHVACADGELTTLRADSGEVLGTRRYDAELRDVLVRGDHLLVSTFKSAQLLILDASGEIEASIAPQRFQVSVFKRDSSAAEQGGDVPLREQLQPMQPHLAWRTAQATSGEVVMLHQGESEDMVDITNTEPDPQASPYGGGGGGISCSGIVTPAVSVVDSVQGSITTVPVAAGPLAVDLALSNEGMIAIAQAGSADPQAPRPMTVFEGDGISGGASLIPRAAPPLPVNFPGSSARVGFVDRGSLPPGVSFEHDGQSVITLLNQASMIADPSSGFGGCQFGSGAVVAGQATAVAFTSKGELLVQSREPSLLTTFSFDGSGDAKTIALGGASVRDTGHEIFHRDAGGGIACASCHAEGAEDGHTWKFTGLGERRTQALHVGLEGTAPFHWGGDERDLGHLMEDVFVGRMGGVHQSGDRLASLTHFLFSLQPPPAMGSASDDAAVRGKELFESADVGCASCHAGAKLTNNQNVDVGTGGKFQVPSLRGIGYRAPFMHTGCAATLEQRFDPACGGAKHGNVEGLSQVEIGDMVAYLRTL